MKLLILAALVAFAAADVSHLHHQHQHEAVPILKQDVEVNPDGSYQWSYESADGSSQQQQGQLKNVGSEAEAQVVTGQASWQSPEGENVQISYVADENGYQPQGSHLPTPPPIPEGILRGLRYTEEHPPKP